MYKNYKIVANSAMGRRQYAKLLVPQVIASPIVDRYDLWVNTLNKQDIAFFEEMAKEFPKINLVWHPTGEINGIASMKEFYPLCQDEDTIYIKLDDDVVWFDPNFFEEICKFRIDNPDYFLVSPLVINNGICNYILQDKGKIEFNRPVTCQAYDLKFYNGHLAKEIHNWFIDNYLVTNKYPELYCGLNKIAMQKFAINAIAWFGKEFQKFEGKVARADEEFLTVTYPVANNLVNCFDCNTIVAHYSFSVQRALLDSTNILSKYEQVINDNATPDLKEILKKTQNILEKIKINSQNIENTPYSHGYKPGVPEIDSHVKKRRQIEKIAGFLGVPKPLRRFFISDYLNIITPHRNYIKK